MAQTTNWQADWHKESIKHYYSTEHKLKDQLALCNRDRRSIKNLKKKLAPLHNLFCSKSGLDSLLQSLEKGKRTKFGRMWDLYQVLRHSQISREELAQPAVNKMVKFKMVSLLYHEKINEEPSNKRAQKVRECLKLTSDFLKTKSEKVFLVLENNQDAGIKKNPQYSYLDDVAFEIRYGLNGDCGGAGNAFEARKFQEYLRKWNREMSLCGLSRKFPSPVFKHGGRLASRVKELEDTAKIADIATHTVKLTNKEVWLNQGNAMAIINGNHNGVQGLDRCRRDLVTKSSETLENVLDEWEKPTDWHLLAYRFEMNRYGCELEGVEDVENANLWIVLRQKGGQVGGYVVVPEPLLSNFDDYKTMHLHAIAYKVWHRIEWCLHFNAKDGHLSVTPHVWGYHYECCCKKLWKHWERSTYWYPYKYPGKGRQQVEVQHRRCEVMKYACWIKVDPEHTHPDVEDYLRRRPEVREEMMKHRYDRHRYKMYLGVEQYKWRGPEMQPILSDYQVSAYLDMLKQGEFGVTHKIKQRFKHFAWFCYMWASSKAKRDEMKKNKPRGDAGLRQIHEDSSQAHPVYEAELRNVTELTGIQDENAMRLTNINMLAANLYFGPGPSYIKPHAEHDKFDEWIWSAIYGQESWLSIGMGVHGYNSGLTAIPTKDQMMVAYDMKGFAMYKHSHCVLETHLLWTQKNWRLSKLMRHAKAKVVKQAMQHKCKLTRKHSKVCECVEVSKGPYNCKLY